jgi:predicted DCC family thiol-disulfide oxidoreductase YuxK
MMTERSAPSRTGSAPFGADGRVLPETADGAYPFGISRFDPTLREDESLQDSPVNGGSADWPVCTTLYNGACPVCRMEINHYRELNQRQGSHQRFIDLHQADAMLAQHGLNREDVKRRLHVIGADDQVHIGVAAFLQIWSHLKRYRWLVPIVSHRYVRPLAEFIYERILAPALYGWNRWMGR